MKRIQAVSPAQAALAKWTPKIPLSLVPISGAVLDSGKLLLWSSGGSTTLFDPASSTATDRVVTETQHSMFCPGTARLPDGTLLVNGGDSASVTSLYNPATNTWTRAPDMKVTRGYNASTPLWDGTVLTMGGSWSGGQGPKPGEVFTPGSGWRALSGVTTANPDFITKDQAGYFRSDNHMWLIPAGNGKVLHAGPARTMNWIDTRGNGTASPAGPRADDTDSMSGNAVMYDAGKILTLGGSIHYEGVDAKNSAYVIDINSGAAVTRAVAPMAYPRVFSNSVVLPNGQVVVLGGQTRGAPFSDAYAVLPAELWDPQTETFTVLPAMSVARTYHSIGLLLPDGRVISSGGGGCGCAADHPDMQILSPPYLFNADGSAAARPSITAAPNTLSYGGTATVTTDGPVTAFSLIRVGATTHTVDNDQRRIALGFTAGANNSYQLAVPTNPGILLPGQWMLFAMKANGTPSVAKIVTVSNNGSPVLENPGNLNTVTGRAVNLSLVAATPAGSLSFSASNLPTGLKIDPKTGTISGAVQSATSALVTISASNGSQTVSTDIVVNVTAVGTGTGLLATYYGNPNLSGTPALTRTEAPDFNWGTGSPAAGLPADNFSVRWTGFIEATASGSTQIGTVSDDGVRVWVDNRLIIDNWTVHAATANSATVTLVAGKRYPVMVEYYEGGGEATLKLQWQPPGAAAPVAVPADRLYPASSPSTTNIALGRAATQSATALGGDAARAVDGNTDGNFSGNSVTHTAGTAAQDWWQVDLGRKAGIDLVQLWNRSDCCADRLSNFMVFVADNDMSGRTLDQLKADPLVSARAVGASSVTPTIGIPVGLAGRYVRVQLTGTNFLSLAEVQVFGQPVVYQTPTVNAISNQQSTLGASVLLAVKASDPDGNPLTYAATGLPGGLAINAQTGLISGTPTTAGTSTVRIGVANAGGLAASTSFSWTVTQATPQVGMLPAPVMASGATVSYAPVVSNSASVQFSWNFGDGSADTAYANSAKADHVFAAPGVYTVTLSMRTADGRTSTYRFVQAIQAGGILAQARASGTVLLEPRSTGAARLWVVNADNDSVSIFDTGSNTRVAELAVGAAPRTLARAPDGRIWVVNKGAASISIVSPSTLAVVQTLALPRASQPHGIVFSPSDGSAFVTLEATGQLLKLNGSSGAKLGALDLGPNPRHLSLSATGDRLLVSRFITRPLPGEGTATVQTASANGTPFGGEVLVIDPVPLALLRTTVLAHSDRADSENQGRGIPNYLGAPAISPDGKTAWVPSKQDNIKRGGRRDGNALNFQNTVRAISSRIDLGSLSEDLAGRIDHDNAGVPSAAVYHPSGAYLFVALETNRQVAVIDAVGKRELFRFEVGLAPQGLVVSNDGWKLYVSNFMDRSISVIDLLPLVNFGQTGATSIITLPSVATEKLAGPVLQGKQLFYDARDARLARDSYMSCASCHNDGGHDGRVWDLTSQGEGLRNTISLRGRAGAQGRLHWSGNFDEVQDFEGQIRSLAGGTGLMGNADFNTGTRSQPLGDKKAGVSADLDKLAAYVSSLGTFAPSPARQGDGAMTVDALAGKTVFAAKCASCHNGTDFSDSAKLVLHNVGTQKPSSGQRLGKLLTGLDVPTLRDVWATAPYLHDGSAPTLEAAVQAHSNLSLSSTELATVVAYTKQIGAEEAAAPASQANLVVRILSTLMDQVGALFDIRVNGAVVASGQLDSRSYVDILVDTARLVKGAIVEVVFKNDANSATEDRNMAVQSITLNGSAVLPATAPGVVIDKGTGALAFDGQGTVTGASTGGWMPWDSAMRFAVPALSGGDTVVVRASASLAGGVGAQMALRINGIQVASQLVSNSVAPQAYSFTTPTVTAGDRIDIVFTNDAVIGAEDRNLYVQSITARGVTILSTAAGVTLDQGDGAQAFDGVGVVPASTFNGWLPWNGAMRFVAQ